MKTGYIYIIILFALSSCSTQNLFVKNANDFTEAIVDSSFLYDPCYQYKIRKDDKIAISVWGQDELSTGSVYGIYNSNEVYGKWLLVDANGNIEIPKIGTTYVLDKTIPELKESLRQEFQKWVVNSIVDVKVLNKEITVLGELRNPGTIKIDKDQNRLLEIISKAGGTEFYANLKIIKILRQEGEHVRVTNIDLTLSNDLNYRNVTLHPGDIVIVPSKKCKDFDKRVSTIIPFTSTITAAAILIGFF